MRSWRGGSQRLPRGSNTPALAGSKLAYVRELRGCDVPFVRDLRTGRTKRFGRGTCATIQQLDLSARWLVAVATYSEQAELESEARAYRLSGAGRPDVFRYIASGEAPHEVTSVAVDGDRAVALAAGARSDTLYRYDMRTKRSKRVGPPLATDGAMAMSGTTVIYSAARPLGGDPDDPDENQCPRGCLLVESPDPFAGPRALPPVINAGPVFADDPVLAGRVTREEVRDNGERRRLPVAGQQVSLLDAAGNPTGLVSPVAADGAWAIRVPPIAGVYVPYTAVVGPPGGRAGIASDGVLGTIASLARIQVVAERLADGRVRFTGTVSPSLPGREIWVSPEARLLLQRQAVRRRQDRPRGPALRVHVHGRVRARDLHRLRGRRGTLDRRPAGPLGGVRDPLGHGRFDDQVRDGDVELVAQPRHDPGLEPVGLLRGMRGDQHLVGAGAAQLVLDRAQRDVRVADRAGDVDALLARPVQRIVEPLARVAQLAVDVRGDVARARAQDRRDQVHVRAVAGAVGDLGPQLRAGERPVGHHEHLLRPAGGVLAPERHRLLQRPATVRVRRHHVPDQRPGEGADEQRDPATGLTNAPSSTDAAITAPLASTMWKASASERMGLRTAELSAMRYVRMYS